MPAEITDPPWRIELQRLLKEYQERRQAMKATARTIYTLELEREEAVRLMECLGLVTRAEGLEIEAAQPATIQAAREFADEIARIMRES